MTTYIDHHKPVPTLIEGRSGFGSYSMQAVCTHSWAAHTRLALTWHYGDRADLIQSGRDPKTQADLTAWRALGERRVA